MLSKLIPRKIKVYLYNKFPILLPRLLILVGQVDKTYAGELKALLKTLDIANLPNKKKFVDIGSGNGFNMSSSYFLASQNWSGLLIDFDKSSILQGKRLFKKWKSIKFYNGFITPENVIQILSSFNFLDANYIKIDIDSFDYYVLSTILNGQLRPEVISIEINERIPPGIFFHMKFPIEKILDDKEFYGCSISSAWQIGMEHGYIPIALSFNNLFYVRSDQLELQSDSQVKSAKELYVEGYSSKPNRDLLFPWNREFHELIDLSTNEVIVEIERRLNMKKIRDFFELY